jgi:hypothetical protein
MDDTEKVFRSGLNEHDRCQPLQSVSDELLMLFEGSVTLIVYSEKCGITAISGMNYAHFITCMNDCPCTIVVWRAPQRVGANRNVFAKGCVRGRTSRKIDAAFDLSPVTVDL